MGGARVVSIMDLGSPSPRPVEDPAAMLQPTAAAH
jgi:hypothetical protein